MPANANLEAIKAKRIAEGLEVFQPRMCSVSGGMANCIPAFALREASPTWEFNRVSATHATIGNRYFNNISKEQGKGTAEYGRAGEQGMSGGFR